MKLSLHQKTIIAFVMMVFCFIPLKAQEHPYSVGVAGSITTTSRLFFSPYDVDIVARNQSMTFSNVWGMGIDVRRELQGNHFHIGISAEFLSTNEAFTVLSNTGVPTPVEDGYVSFPVEVTGYFTIPFGSEILDVYMGGGFGGYFGERHYMYSGVKSHITARKPGFGIHVLSGLEYHISSILALRGEIKFREVQFESTNVFVPDQGYIGMPLPYNETPFTSRMSIDGLMFNVTFVTRF